MLTASNNKSLAYLTIEIIRRIVKFCTMSGGGVQFKFEFENKKKNFAIRDFLYLMIPESIGLLNVTMQVTIIKISIEKL